MPEQTYIPTSDFARSIAPRRPLKEHGILDDKEDHQGWTTKGTRDGLRQHERRPAEGGRCLLRCLPWDKVLPRDRRRHPSHREEPDRLRGASSEPASAD